MAEGLADEVCEGMDVSHQDKIGTVVEVFEVVRADASEMGADTWASTPAFSGAGAPTVFR